MANSIHALIISLAGLTITLSTAFTTVAHAQSSGTFTDGQEAVEVTDEAPATLPERRARKSDSGFNPRVGRRAAAKYMAPKKDAVEAADGAGRKPSSEGPSDHFLAVHLGWFVNDNAYKWGAPDAQTNVGKWNLGVTYRVGEWVNSMDLLFRFDVLRYKLNEGEVTKFSFLPVVTFPDASSRFPLYFGAGLGLGIFGSQLPGESTVALDYQLMAGARFFNIWGQSGLFVESGIKNHLHLFSDGQFNGIFISAGLVFAF